MQYTQRAIKFRAWQKIKTLHRDIGMYDVADLVFYGKPEHGGGEAFFWGDGDVTVSSEYFEDLILLQFTGLHDKHGVEIYEGDVVRTTDHPFMAASQDKDEANPYHYDELVRWDEDRGQWMAGLVTFLFDHAELEVIGNVYEHPDLLEAAA